MLAELLSFNVFLLFLVFARVGTLIMLLPGIGAGYVAVRVRLVLALAVALVLVPALAGDMPPLPPTPVQVGLLVLGEVLVGAFLGTVVRVIVAALHAAGTFASYFMSLANALVQDPVADQQTSTIAGFFATVGVLLIFVTDLHHLLFRAVADSYELFPAAAPVPVGDFAEALGRGLAESFVLGLQMAAPFVILGFAYYLGLGLLGRLMPQLPVFFFGLPLQISLQLWVMALTLSAVLMVFLGRFADHIGAFVAP